MRIGGFTPQSPFFLCPLAGYTDLPFRRIVRRIGGLGLAYTELVNPKGLKAGSPRSLEIVETDDDDRPLVVQLYGTSVPDLCEAAVWAAERGSPIVDINMGCPVPKVAGKGGGSGILRCCPDAVALAGAVVKACPTPVTVKTRLGWEMGNLVAPDLVRRFEDVGVAAVTIHGRYGEQKFSGKSDWDAITRVVEAAKNIPVIGNGDVRTADDAIRMMKHTGCAGVMIGRRALADPWIFRDAFAQWTTGEAPPKPMRHERAMMMAEHLQMLIDRHGERRGCVEFRTRISWWAKGLAPCPDLRRNGPRISSKAEFDALLNDLLRNLDEEITEEESLEIEAAA